MKRALPLAMWAALAFSAPAVMAQGDRFAYAITDLTKEGAGWNALRRLDLQTGQYSEVLVNGTDVTKTLLDAVSKEELPRQPDAQWGNLLQSPFATGVAAAAYDRRHNRLYFTPMFVDQLRYVDLKTLQVYQVTGQAFSGAGNMHRDEAKIITRMVIAPDGYGYAVSNDGAVLVRFSTGKKPQIENLGSLTDNPENAGISIHNRSTSFGGDMVCDDDGNLYLLTARNHVFKVSTTTRVATHLGAIQGLPANFTVNGAVVDAEGNLLVSSAVDASAYYAVNPNGWQAAAYTGLTAVFRSSDLANSNYLSTAKRNDFTAITTATEKFARQISVYPNPVANNRVSVQFDAVPAGNYTLMLTDMLGRSVQQKQINVRSQQEVQELLLGESQAKGLYMMKVFDNGKKPVFTQKVVVQ